MKRQAQKAKGVGHPFHGHLKSGLSIAEEYKSDTYHKDDHHYEQPLVSPQDSNLKNQNLA
jgi:hypothetical protein